MILIICLILILFILLIRVKELDLVKEGFYEFVQPTSLNIPDMFKLSDKHMENIFDSSFEGIPFRQENRCK